MGFHRLPAIANRLRVNRGFDSAWYTDGKSYAKVLQKDWLLAKTVASFVQRSSRTLPKTFESREQQLLNLVKARQAMGKGEVFQKSEAATAEQAAKQQKDFPNFRVGRVFMQHLPYKSIASTFAWIPRKDGPQAKYGLEKPMLGQGGGQGAGPKR
eukprot:gene13518-19383_t